MNNIGEFKCLKNKFVNCYNNYIYVYYWFNGG